MTARAPGPAEVQRRTFPFPARHFLSVGDLDRDQVSDLLDLAEGFVALNRQKAKKLDLMKGRTLVNLFFEASTRTQSSFELAGKRLGADVVNMSPRASSIVKGETLIDTAVTLNAMQPDILVVRHSASRATSPTTSPSASSRTRWRWASPPAWRCWPRWPPGWTTTDAASPDRLPQRPPGGPRQRLRRPRSIDRRGWPHRGDVPQCPVRRPLAGHPTGGL